MNEQSSVILDTEQSCVIRQHDNGDKIFVVKMAETVWWIVILGKGCQIQITSNPPVTRDEMATEMSVIYGGYPVEYDNCGLFPPGTTEVPMPEEDK